MRAKGRPQAAAPIGVWRFLALTALTSGCVASIHEDRLYGAPRPRDDGAPDVVPEHRQGEGVLGAAVHGPVLDVSLVATTECREVDVTSRVRDVTLRRTFANSAQETNGVLAMLAAGSIGALQYSAEQIDCPQGGACWSAMITSEYTMLALAAVPVGFLVYNALRVHDGHTIEQAEPEVREQGWRPCSHEPLPGEAIVIATRDVELTRTTDRAGHASVDLASLLPPSGSAETNEPPRATLRHAGSSDYVVDLASPTP